jgi:hypothetical protein
MDEGALRRAKRELAGDMLDEPGAAPRRPLRAATRVGSAFVALNPLSVDGPALELGALRVSLSILVTLLWKIRHV